MHSNSERDLRVVLNLTLRRKIALFFPALKGAEGESLKDAGSPWNAWNLGYPRF